MNEEDYFGFISLDASKQESQCDLDQLGKNKILKFKMLDKVLNQEQFSINYSNNRISLRSALEQAYYQSSQIESKEIQYLNFEYTYPLKWIVALLSNFSHYGNMNGLDFTGQTNLILVFITNEMPDDAQLDNANALIRSTSCEGGILILRYRGGK